eukprot:CAMPEP_0197864402 /NCGR_PEP_ID=MMETSP1438-20131217/42619_1 /TAXON_ID=1461541 /ORGANISM="Pterosperma sp., Strain CCMP1384" /LENGTH=69 /DNA_ID=CAMNT_0043482639 /DNA_START=54 /DNA_END=260 /DNA_ORIENTATION=-
MEVQPPEDANSFSSEGEVTGIIERLGDLTLDAELFGNMDILLITPPFETAVTADTPGSSNTDEGADGDD